MSKFDAILKRIEEQMPVMTPQTNQTAPQNTQPNTTAQQAAEVDPKIVQELIAAKDEQQVKMALQKLQALQTAQQKPGQYNQSAV